MPNIVVSSEEPAGHPTESLRTEPGRCIDQSTAGVARPAPRVWDRDVGGRKVPEMNPAWADPSLTEFLRELAFQMARGIVQASQRFIGYEDGKNMRNFLDLAELDFIERGLEERQWGEELKRYLKGDALGYWLYLRRTGEPLTDWEQLRQRFCARFCGITKEWMKVMIAENVWRGDHHAYSARFEAIVAEGVSVAPDLLVGYYLANLPEEIFREITQGGTRKFADWQEAAAALATTVAPWKDLCEDRLRFQRDLEDAKRRWAKGGREPGLLRERENRDNRRNDTTDSRCYACSGRGHSRARPAAQTAAEAAQRRPIGAFKRTSLAVKGDERARRTRSGKGAMCAVATGPNSIPVSPDWGKRLRIGEKRERAEGPDVGETQQPPADQSHAETTLQIKEGSRRRLDHSGELNDATTEGDRPQDTSTKELQWWREQRVQEDATPKGTLCSVGMSAVLRVEVAGNQCEALLDTGASRSFISPGAVERLQLRGRKLPEEHVFTVANGAQLRIDRVVKGLTMWCGATRLAGDFLVGPVPYDLVVGLDWLTEHRVAWYFQSDKLRTYVNGQWCDLPVVRATDATQRNGSTLGTRQRTPAEQAYDILAKQVADMTREEATALLRPPSKRFKPPSRGKRKAVVAALLQQASESAACIRQPLQGLYVILALPAMESDVALRLVEEWQGALCCALVETSPSNPHRQCLKALPASAFPDEEETSPWPTAKLEYSQFHTWLTSVEAQATPRVILDVLCAHRAVFPDKLPSGLPPKRPHDHRILLVPGKLPTKSSIYRMTPEQLLFHKQEIAKLSANGWIGPTYSPICAPTIMVDKRSDGTGERKMRMVVNYWS
ncbi:Reverse transcriptase, related [Eimeria necatrix]|uniref:Reverse transcriptase, related n=1 Tax=Eimeria necatrix TaxID=51315 RepID=U6MEC8_9EIME|nr:Reverse transcriptase, related [Eimeria necatrix]CDJ62567.1 Reverse transcriptase, related [Eimeria necatrix]